MEKKTCEIFNMLSFENCENAFDSMEEMLAHVDSATIESTPITPGQKVVMISSFPVGSNSLPNLALLHEIGSRS